MIKTVRLFERNYKLKKIKIVRNARNPLARILLNLEKKK